MTGGSNVTVQEGAAYVPTKDNGAADADYVKGDVFLKQGTVYTEPSAKVDFAVSEAGQAKEYFTDDRAVTDESDITHEWFVDQTQYVTIRPADITVYTGGNSYDGVTDENGQIVSGSGLPEAGYLLTVPEEINDMLEGPGQAVDLAGHLTFTYGAGETVRAWDIQLYSGGATSTTDPVDGIARYIYRMESVKEGQDPVRLQFTDPETGEVKISDEFEVSAIEQNRTYSMTIYSGGVDQDLVKAVFKDIPEHSDETFTYPVKIEEGALTIRGATKEGVTAPVEDKADDVTGDAITAVAPADVTYYVNDSQVEITDKNAVHLLTDEVLDDQVLIDHISNEIIGSDTGIPNGDYLYEFQYLDLVDSSNGNAYVTLGDGQTMISTGRCPTTPTPLRPSISSTLTRSTATTRARRTNN